MNKLDHTIVTVEARRASRHVPQCYRCQRYGHTKNYCAMPPRCVKCKGNHLTNECSKPTSDPPQCVNCNDNHPANFRGCKYYLEQINSRNKPTPSRQRQHESTIPTFSAQPNTTLSDSSNNHNKTYANAIINTNPPQNSNQPTTSSTDPIINTIISAILSCLQPLLHQIKTLIITNLSNILQKND